MSDEQTEREPGQPDGDETPERAQAGPAEPFSGQILGVIVGQPVPGTSGLRVQLQASPEVTAAAGTRGLTDFYLMVAKLAVENAALARGREQASPIQVPQIAIPPGVNLRGDNGGPVGPIPPAVPFRRSRGKGRRR